MVVAVSDLHVPRQQAVRSEDDLMITGKETVYIGTKTIADSKMSANTYTVASAKFGFPFKFDFCASSYFQIPPPRCPEPLLCR